MEDRESRISAFKYQHSLFAFLCSSFSFVCHERRHKQNCSFVSYEGWMSGHISVMDSRHLHLSACCLLFGSLLSVVIYVVHIVVV